ncbi:Magnesium and cobalt efflux protein CorC [compost metagenome]
MLSQADMGYNEGRMFTFTVIILVVVFALLILAAGVRPTHSAMSQFELDRRQATGDKIAVEVARREKLLDDVISLQRAVVALFLVMSVVLAVSAFGWLFGTILAVAIALEYGVVARMRPVQSRAQQIYVRYEGRLLNFVEKFPMIARLLRSVSDETAPSRQLDSREELEHLVSRSGSLITSDERKLILHSLTFGSRTVNEIMTPKGMIDSIDKKELLGPLVLDDLHKTGHSRFPVIDKDIDHVVGMLYVQDLLTAGAKRSETVEKTMASQVFYIREDQSLHHALSAFLRTHHHLFIVVNEFRETVGLISLEDVLEALLGRKIIDEFDAHDDLRAVALRNPHGNNHPPTSQDV